MRWARAASLATLAAVPSLGQTRAVELAPVPQIGHSGDLHGLAFSPDGTRLASLSSGTDVVVWDLLTGVQVARFQGARYHASALAFSPDGEILAVSSRDGVALWNAGSGRLERELHGHGDSPHELRFSPNGRLLVGPVGETVLAWDLASGGFRASLAGKARGDPWGLALSPDGEMLAAGGGADVVLFRDLYEFGGWSWWDVVARLTAEDQGSEVMRFSLDGRRLVTWATRHPVLIWDLETTTHTVAPLPDNIDQLRRVTLSEDGRLLAGVRDDRAAEVWEVSTGARLQSIPARSGEVHCVSFAPDTGSIAIAKGDTIGLYDLETGEPTRVLASHAVPATTVAYSPDDQLMACGSGDGTLAVWEARTGRRRWATPGGEVAVTALAFSADGELLACGDEHGTVRICDTRVGEFVHELRPADGASVFSLAFSPDGELLAAGAGDTDVRLWDLADGSLRRTLAVSYTGFVSVAFSSDGGRLAAGATSRVRSSGYSGAYQDMPPAELRVWEVGRTKPLWVESHAFGISGAVIVSFGPADRMVLLSGARYVGAWDAGTGAEIGKLSLAAEYSPRARYGDPERPLAMADPRGRTVRMGAHNPRLRWFSGWADLAFETLELECGWVSAVAFSSDGRRIAAACRDGLVRIFDSRSGELLATTWSAEGAGEAWLAWTPQGYYVCSAGGEQYLGLRDGEGVVRLASSYKSERRRSRALRQALGPR